MLVISQLATSSSNDTMTLLIILAFALLFGNGKGGRRR